MKLFVVILAFVGLIGFVSFTAEIVKDSDQNQIEKSKDVIRVGYTYWWPQSGPFIRKCGRDHSLVVYGEVVKKNEPLMEEDQLYVPQFGTVRIDEVLFLSESMKVHYKEQPELTTDCFYETGIEEGQKVMIFCYEYEDYFSIPGANCIVSVEGESDPLYLSTKSFLESDRDVNEILAESEHWIKAGYGVEMEGLRSCVTEK